MVKCKICKFLVWGKDLRYARNRIWVQGRVSNFLLLKGEELGCHCVHQVYSLHMSKLYVNWEKREKVRSIFLKLFYWFCTLWSLVLEIHCPFQSFHETKCISETTQRRRFQIWDSPLIKLQARTTHNVNCLLERKESLFCVGI